MTEQADRVRWARWWQKWRSVIIVMVATSGLALVLIWRWAVRVDEWAAHARMVQEGTSAQCSEKSGELRNYAVPGTYGDAFAPIVGVMTALALGATVASAFMQREEMEEARKQFTAQATEMKDANTYAQEANELARTAQLIEVWRQIAELERTAVSIVESAAVRQHENVQAYPGLAAQYGPPIGDPRIAWRKYWEGGLAERSRAKFDSVEMCAYADTRSRLHEMESAVRASRSAESAS